MPKKSSNKIFVGAYIARPTHKELTLISKNERRSLNAQIELFLEQAIFAHLENGKAKAA